MSHALGVTGAQLKSHVDAFLVAHRAGILNIVGPTASGKTELGLQIAEAINGEIVLCDSRQVYDIVPALTTAPTVAEQARVPHHGVHMLPPEQQWTAHAHQAWAYKKIQDIMARGRVPVLLGGTMLWADAITRGYGFGEVPDVPQWPSLTIMPVWEREVLYTRINQRTAEMVAQGVIEQAAEAWHDTHCPNVQKIVGMRHARDWARGLMTKTEWLRVVARATRKYAKRQLTWWRGRDEVICVQGGAKYGRME